MAKLVHSIGSFLTSKKRKDEKALIERLKSEATEALAFVHGLTIKRQILNGTRPKTESISDLIADLEKTAKQGR